MACKYNIKVVEHNDFTLLFPLKKRTYVASLPIDEDIVIMDLENVKVTIGGVEFASTLDERGVMVAVAYDALERGTYDIIITAEYNGAQIRAAYFEGLTIVNWNMQSDAEQYLPGSPIVMQAAFVIGGPMTDAELEALKEEYREKNAQLDQAIADAETAKREWEEKAADLDGVAKEATSQEIKTAVENIDIDTTDLAKQGMNPNATLTDTQTAAQSAASDAADAKTAAEQASSATSGIPAIANAIIGRTYDGITVYSQQPISWIALAINMPNIKVIEDDAIVTLVGTSNMFGGISQLKELTLNKCEIYSGLNTFVNNYSIEKLYMPEMISCTAGYAFHRAVLTEVYIPKCEIISNGNAFIGTPIRILDISNLISGHNNLGLNSVDCIDLRTGKKVQGNFTLASWSPTNALDANSTTLLTPEDIAAGFTSNLQKLLYNIREHIAANLPVAPYTITFSAAVKAAILADQPTADAFTNKNWTIA